jgi:hypothetical protein
LKLALNLPYYSNLSLDGLDYGVLHHFLQYFSYIVVEETGAPREHHQLISAYNRKYKNKPEALKSLYRSPGYKKKPIGPM